jgi:hypothetical protein
VNSSTDQISSALHHHRWTSISTGRSKDRARPARLFQVDAGGKIAHSSSGPSATQVLFSYSIQANTIPEPARVPKDFTMQSSSDGSHVDHD